MHMNCLQIYKVESVKKKLIKSFPMISWKFKMRMQIKNIFVLG